MSAPAITPLEIRQAGPRELAIRWSDGRESVYDVRDLRLACGCATCVDEWTGGGLIDPARVTCGDNVMLLSENESTYIPIGMTHRLENPGKLPLHLIEVQSGSYLGEDDIVRFEDIYKRA